MNLSESYVRSRAIDVISSIAHPRQALTAQTYCHLLIGKMGDRVAGFYLIYVVRDLLTDKLRQFGAT